MAQNKLMTEAVAIFAEHKTNKKLEAAVLLLLEEYSSKAKKDTIIRDKNIMLDGHDYRWCNRHEIYEPVSNFKQKDACKLAVKVWSSYGKMIKSSQDKLELLIESGEFSTEDIISLNKEIKEAKETRGARYIFEDNKLQFPEIAEYIYDYSTFITDDMLG